MQGIFEQHRERPWIFLRNLGNWGDELLFAGAEVMATRAGARWTSYETPEFERLEIPADHCIYLQGGGGFNEWSSGRAFTNLRLAVQRSVHLVVQGPMTLGGDRNWLRRQFLDCLGIVNCHDLRIFARERLTADGLQGLGLETAGAILGLDHDTALAFSSRDLLDLAGLDTMPKGRYELTVVREDPEQPANPVTRGWNWPSRGAIVIDPAYEAGSFRHWLRIHLFARSIVTNRLHSSIVGHIAGKSVTLGPGSYHKNRSVWEYSLKDRGPAWVDELPPVGAPVWSLLPERIRESYKLRRLRLLLHRVPLS